MEILQKYYKNITFILKILIDIDFLWKKDKIYKGKWAYKTEKNTSIIYYIL